MNEHDRSAKGSPDPSMGGTIAADGESKEPNDAIIDGRYELHERLGEGGMGSVYRATHILMGKPVAVKLINDELSHMPSVIKRFEREARSASLLSDPHCIMVTDFGRSPRGDLYLVMELLDGEELATRLEREGALQPRTAVSITRQILSALAHAHAAGVVHRDLKPENVMLIEQGGSRDFVKVFDFGIAKIAGGPDNEEPLTQAGMVIGTPAYLSPEQALGDQADERSDIYAVGVMLYQMLAGEVPFGGDTAVKVLSKHLSDPVPRLPSDGSIPSGLQEAIDTAMAKKIGDRFQTAEDFIAALDAVSFDPEKTEGIEEIGWTSTGMTGHVERASLGGRRGLLGFIKEMSRGARATALILIAAALIGAFIWLPGGDLGRQSPEELLEVSEAPPGVDENTIKELLEKADQELRSGLLNPAAETIAQVLKLSPDQPAALLLSGHAHFSKSQYSKALELYEKALDAKKTFYQDPRLLEYLAAIFEKTADQGQRAQAAAVLAKKMDRPGVDFLENQANSMTSGLDQREAARVALIDAGKDDSIDWLTSLTADFNDAKGCKKKKEIIGKMAETKNRGFLPLLLENRPKETGRGPFRRFRGENKCIGSAVKKAIEALDPGSSPHSNSKKKR